MRGRQFDGQPLRERGDAENTVAFLDPLCGLNSLSGTINEPVEVILDAPSRVDHSFVQVYCTIPRCSSSPTSFLVWLQLHRVDLCEDVSEEDKDLPVMPHASPFTTKAYCNCGSKQAEREDPFDAKVTIVSCLVTKCASFVMKEQLYT